MINTEFRILLRDDGTFQFGIGDHFLDICPHWSTLGLDRNLDERFEKMLACNMKHETTKPCLLCNSIIECSSCTTEFVIFILKCEWSFYKRAIYITAWKDLGSCETPFDNSWRTQCYKLYTDPDTRDSLPRDPVHFEPGSIRNAYEGLGYPKLKDDGIASMWPLDSDVEYSRRLDQCSKRDSDFSKIIRGEILDT